MVRYTDEQKKAALEKAKEIGVLKTHEELGISVQTLYKWRTEAEGAGKEKTKRAPRAKKAEKTTLQELLDNDAVANKIRRLEEENAELLAANVQLKKALLSILEK